MPGACNLVKGLKPIIGNNVSHSNQKTRKKFHLNLQKSTFVIFSNDKEIKKIELRLANSTRRTIINKHGNNLASFLLNTANSKLTSKALIIKSDLLKKIPQEEIDSLIIKKEPKIELIKLKKQPKARLIKKKEAKKLKEVESN